jgi:DNA-binding NarL/FixJ family response regulator
MENLYTPEPIRVAVVEDTEIIREAITMFLQHTDGFECCGIYTNSEDAIAGIPALKPDVVLMDIGLPGMNGIDCIAHLRPLCDNTQFLVCTVFEDNDNIFEALKSGATGYILKKSSPTEILDAIRELYQGGSPMSSSIARKVIAQFHEPRQSEEARRLTDRENEILNLLSQGFRYKEISDKLNISFTTVRTHIHNIYEKLQVQSRTAALNKVFPRKRFSIF